MPESFLLDEVKNMKIVVGPRDPGDPKKFKYKFLEWVQNSLPKLFLYSGVLSIGLLIAGYLLDRTYSSVQMDYTWFQRSGALVVGWSILIEMLQQTTFNHSVSLKGANAPEPLNAEIKKVSRLKEMQAFWLWVIKAFSLFGGTLVWAFGDMITDRLLHCGQWICS